jgi:hypothetical protein
MINLEDVVAKPRRAWSDTCYSSCHPDWAVGENDKEENPSWLYIPLPGPDNRTKG